MFAYCGNNPIKRVDPEGNLWIEIAVIALLYGVLLTGCEETGPYSGSANCYAYALNLEYDPNTGAPFSQKPQPSTFPNNPITQDELNKAIKSGEKDAVEDLIIGRVTADCNVLGYSITKVDSADYFPSEGNWLIALGYSSTGLDYHFWKKMIIRFGRTSQEMRRLWR